MKIIEIFTFLLLNNSKVQVYHLIIRQVNKNRLCDFNAAKLQLSNERVGIYQSQKLSNFGLVAGRITFGYFSRC